MRTRLALIWAGTFFAVFFYIAPTVLAAPTAAAEAKMMCGGCHDTSSTSRAFQKRDDGAAPPFALIAQDPRMTPQALRKILQLPHGNMNNVLVTEDEVGALIGYIESLKTPTKSKIGK